MTSDIAIRVENYILRPLLSSSKGRVEGYILSRVEGYILSRVEGYILSRVEGLSKLYHIGARQSRAGDSLRSQRHDAPSTRLRGAPLWDRMLALLGELQIRVPYGSGGRTERRKRSEPPRACGCPGPRHFHPR